MKVSSFYKNVQRIENSSWSSQKATVWTRLLRLLAVLALNGCTVWMR